jgi:acetoin utilization protein AcuB
MKDHPLIKSVMTSFPMSIAIGAPLLDARRMMLEHHVHHLPVTRARELAGIISDRDIKLILGPEFDYPNPRELKVEDAYMPDPYTADLDTPLVDVVTAMAEKHIGAALVTGDGRLAGIFTANDACRCLGDLLRARSAPQGGAV